MNTLQFPTTHHGPTTPPTVPALPPVRPMLASAMTARDFSDYCTPDWCLEEKYDGHRVTVRKTAGSVLAWSRPKGSKPALRRDLPVHLTDALRSLPDGVYDGELMAPGGKAWDVTRKTGRTRQVLVLFDLVECLGQSIIHFAYDDRRVLLAAALENYDGDALTRSAVYQVSDDIIRGIWARGGEGAILKRRRAQYQPGRRSADWVKVKRGGTAVVIISGFKPGKRGPYSKTCFVDADGRTSSVGTLDNATLALIAENPLAIIGRHLVIAYTELTTDGEYRHGVWDHFAGEGE